MPQWKKNTYVLWLAIFIAAICWTMVMPFTPVYLEQLGVSHGAEFWSGIIIAVSSFCSMIMSPIWGAIGDRFGRRMMMLRAGVFLTLGYTSMALVQGPIGLLLVRIMIGLLSGFAPMAVALVGVSTPRQEMGRAMGLVQTAWPSGSIIGPVVGGVLSDWIGIRNASFASAIMIIVATTLVMIMVKEGAVAQSEGRANLLEELQTAASHKLLMAVVLITTLSSASLMALEPVMVPFVQQIAGPTAPGWLSGLLFSIPGATFILAAPWWTQRGGKLGYERTVATGLAASATLYFVQTLVAHPWQLGLLRLTSGVTSAGVDPGVAALLATAVPRNLRGRAFGLNQAASSAGSILGPLLGGWIGSYIDPRGVFVLTGLLFLIGFLWVKRVVTPLMQNSVPEPEEMEA